MFRKFGKFSAGWRVFDTVNLHMPYIIAMELITPCFSPKLLTRHSCFNYSITLQLTCQATKIHKPTHVPPVWIWDRPRDQLWPIRTAHWAVDGWTRSVLEGSEKFKSLSFDNGLPSERDRRHHISATTTAIVNLQSSWIYNWGEAVRIEDLYSLIGPEF